MWKAKHLDLSDTNHQLPIANIKRVNWPQSRYMPGVNERRITKVNDPMSTWPHVSECVSHQGGSISGDVEETRAHICHKYHKLYLQRNFGTFCHNFRAFMWRKIEPKGTFVEKK